MSRIRKDDRRLVEKLLCEFAVVAERHVAAGSHPATETGYWRHHMHQALLVQGLTPREIRRIDERYVDPAIQAFWRKMNGL